MNFVGSSPRGRPGTSGFQGKSGFSGFSGISGYSGYSGFAPPLPAFSNVVLAVGLNSFNPAGYPAGLGVNDSDSGSHGETLLFTEVAPYPLDWASSTGVPPLVVPLWADQNLNANDLVQTGSARPVLDAVVKEIDFDGATSCLASSGALFQSDSQTATAYLRFKAGSLIETSVVFETSANGTTTAKQLSVRMVAGVLTVSVGSAIPLLNTKIKTISDSNYHLLSIVIDSTQSAANQVLIWIDGSQTGVTAPLSTDLASQTGMMKNTLFVGARNQASTFFTGSMTDLLVFSAAHDTTLRGSWQTYINTLYP